MKLRIPNLLLFIVVLFIAPKLHAAHIIGGEISYTYLTGNDYQVRLKLYRDCNSLGAPFDDPAYLFIYEAATGNLSRVESLTLPGSNVLPVETSPCLVSPPDICVEEAIYQKIISLPPLVGGYNLVYQRCCRNNSIVNLFDPGGTGSTYVAFVPDPGGFVNSSPEFNDFPPILICRGEPLSFDHSATDPDGDVLVYELCRPFEGATPGCPMPNPFVGPGCPPEPGPPPYATVAYTGAYGPGYPLDAAPGLAIDGTTGLLTGTPTMEGQFVVGICAKEYRAGVLIATHYRDFQFNIVNCDPIVLASIPEQIINCDDFTVVFDNMSFGASTYLWDFGVAGATSTGFLASYTFPDTGTYLVTLIAEPGVVCSDTAYSTVSIYPSMLTDFSVDPSCPGDATLFTDLTTHSYGVLDNWAWDFGDGGVSTLANPDHAYGAGGSYSVTLISTTDLGCEDTLSTVIFIPEGPDPAVGVVNDCIDSLAVFTDFSTVIGGAVVDWAWDFDDGTIDSGQIVSHVFTIPGTYSVSLTLTADNGCSSDTVISIVIDPPVVASILPVEEICQGESVVLFASGGTSYNWTPSTGLSNPTVADPTASPESTTIYTVEVSDGCTRDEAQVTIPVLPRPITSAGTDTIVLSGDTVLLFATGGVGYSWTPTANPINPDSSLVFATPQSTTIYYVEVTGSNGCSSLDSVFIEVLPRCQSMYFPNAFTPDGDGANDIFRPLAYGDEELLTFELFNRWGQLIFTTTTEGLGWDGTYRGAPQELGTYVFQLRTICEGESIVRNGTVTLIR